MQFKIISEIDQSLTFLELPATFNKIESVFKYITHDYPVSSLKLMTYAACEDSKTRFIPNVTGEYAEVNLAEGWAKLYKKLSPRERLFCKDEVNLEFDERFRFEKPEIDVSMSIMMPWKQPITIGYKKEQFYFKSFAKTLISKKNKPINLPLEIMGCLFSHKGAFIEKPLKDHIAFDILENTVFWKDEIYTIEDFFHEV